MFSNDAPNKISVPKNPINEYWIAFSNDAHGLSPIMSRYYVHKNREIQNLVGWDKTLVGWRIRQSWLGLRLIDGGCRRRR